MEVVSSPAQRMRARYRHELRTLTYVTLDEANGGIIRNLTHCGATVQAVGALRKNQIVRMRFELRLPRVRVETRAQVMWANSSGQCGVRFFDLPPRMVRQINEWIFGNLLDSIPQHAGRNMFAPTWAIAEPIEEEDGLLVSASTPRKIIPLPSVVTRDFSPAKNQAAAIPVEDSLELDWLSQPLSGRSLAWIVDSLIVIAALLLFSLVFLSVTHELPKWPMNLAAGFGAVIFVTTSYWGFFRYLVGASLGTRLARLSGVDFDQDAEASGTRFR